VTHHRSGLAARYHPWRDLRDNWPQVEVRIEAMTGDLLGELRYPVIALRAGTSAAQRRCTLTHELVHLERGVRDCGRWAAREELSVQAEVARRLVPTPLLVAAIRETGGTADLAALAALLEVDTETLELRLRLVTKTERARIRAAAVRDLWSVA
jgi:uncharacterized protein DUF955